MPKIGGQAASLTYNANTIYFTKVTPKATRKLADSTDSSNFDVTSGLIWMAQLAVTASVEVAVEGYFYTDTTDPNLLADLFSSAAARACIIKLSSTVTLGHGNFDIGDLEVGIVTDETTTIKFTLKSNGVFTHGS